MQFSHVQFSQQPLQVLISCYSYLLYAADPTFRVQYIICRHLQLVELLRPWLGTWCPWGFIEVHIDVHILVSATSIFLKLNPACMTSNCSSSHGLCILVHTMSCAIHMPTDKTNVLVIDDHTCVCLYYLAMRV